MVSDVQCLRNGLHAVSVLLHILHAEEVVGSTGCYDQVVIRHLAMVGDYHLALAINLLSLCHEQLHILVIAEHCPDWIRNIICGKHRSRYLIQQWLEQMVVCPVNNSNINILLSQLLCCSHTAKTCTDNNNMRSLTHFSQHSYNNS